MMWRLLAAVLLLAGCASQAAAPGGQPPPAYADGTEYFQPTVRGLVSRSQAAKTGVTRYFMTDSRRICYSFEVPGTWELGREPGVLIRVDRGGVAALWLHSIDELGGGSAEAAIRRAAEESGTRYAQQSRGVAWALTPYENVPGAWKWTLPVETPVGDGKGTVTRIPPRWFLPVADRWIARFTIGAPVDTDPDAFASGVMRSLTTSREPRCYEARLRELGAVR